MALWTYPIMVRRESVFIPGLASRRRRISDVLMMMNSGGEGGGKGGEGMRWCVGGTERGRGSCREGFDESAVAPDDKGLKEREMIRKNGGVEKNSSDKEVMMGLPRRVSICPKGELIVHFVSSKLGL